MAKVLLLADVPNIGKKGTITEVKDGFAANYLLPKKLAKIALDVEIKKAAEESVHQEEFAKKKVKVAQKLANIPQSVLIKNAIKVEVQTSAGGRVHGNIDSSSVLVEAIKAMSALKIFEKKELQVKLAQKIEYVGKYACELHISLVEDGKATNVKIPLYIDVVSISEAKRKTK